MVDREARRYCKETKDKTYRNPNSTRQVHPAAAAAAERRSVAAAATAERSACSNNPLFEGEEDGTAGGETTNGVAPVAAPASATVAVQGATADASSAVGSSNIEGSTAGDVALPFPPVRLRMDISDFSLVALLDYIASKGPLRM